MTAVAGTLLTDALGRVAESVHEVVDGLTDDELVYRVDDQAITIAWIVWHLTRVQDDHVAGVAGSSQVWLTDGWYERFALPLEPTEHGYGHTSDQVARVVVSGDLLLGYHDAVFARSAEFLAGLDDDELSRIVDRSWDPPVTLAVRMVSVVNDCTQHVGQAAFIRGLLDRRR